MCVGRIRKPHGVRGLVIIDPYTLSPSFFIEQGRVFYTDNGIKLSLLNPKIGQNLIIAGIDGYPDRTSVEALINEKLYVERDSLPETDEGEYYFEDLKKMDVFDHNQKKVGRVINVCDYGAGVFLEIKTKTGKIATIPFNKESILNINTINLQITVQSEMLLI